MTGDGLPWLAQARLFASGRDALVALVRWGAAQHGWRRTWLPSYGCPEVPAALLAAELPGVALRPYPDADLTAPISLETVPAEPGDVVVVVNQLGIRAAPDTARLRRRGLVLIEDHSHDPLSAWALDSDADYAFASLRKTLPIPDGGAVWSPRGLALPPEPAPAAAGRLASGLGARPTPDATRLRYRALARAAAGPGDPQPGAAISAVSRALLPGMPALTWRAQRRANLEILAEAASATRGLRVLTAPAGGVAFALTLIFADAGMRASAERRLVARAVVPAVLWPLQPGRHWGAGEADAALSARILSIHGDQRFSPDDMRRLASHLRASLQD